MLPCDDECICSVTEYTGVTKHYKIICICYKIMCVMNMLRWPLICDILYIPSNFQSAVLYYFSCHVGGNIKNVKFDR